MLIISRKCGESFLIDENIEVFVLDVQNDKVKLGISAPQDIKIIRKELRETENANLEAAGAQQAGADSLRGAQLKKKKV